MFMALSRKSHVDQILIPFFAQEKQIEELLLSLRGQINSTCTREAIMKPLWWTHGAPTQIHAGDLLWEPTYSEKNDGLRSALVYGLLLDILFCMGTAI